MAPTIGGSPMGHSGTTAASLSSTNATTVVMMWSRRPPTDSPSPCGVGFSLGRFAAPHSSGHDRAPPSAERTCRHGAQAAVRRPDRRWLPRDGPHPDAVLCDHEFGRATAQSRVAVVRFGVLVTLIASTMADRRGRHPAALHRCVELCHDRLGRFLSQPRLPRRDPIVRAGPVDCARHHHRIMAVEEMPARSAPGLRRS